MVTPRDASSSTPRAPSTASQLVWLNTPSSMMLIVPTSLWSIVGLLPASQAATTCANSLIADAVVVWEPNHLLTAK